jgi:hypothetical protein
MRVAATIELKNEQREQLEKQARARSVSVRLAQRSKMILLAAAGWSDRKIGTELGVKRQTVARWRSRFHLHFTPTSASWLNMVERFFRDLTQKQIRRGCFASVAQLIETIEAYISQHNTDPKPIVWTAKASHILEKVKRARAASNKL